MPLGELIKLLLALLAAGLLSGGCGSSSENTDASSTSKTNATGAPRGEK